MATRLIERESVVVCRDGRSTGARPAEARRRWFRFPRWRPSSSASCRPATAGSMSRNGTASGACSRTSAARCGSGRGTEGPCCATSPSSSHSATCSPRSALDGEIVIEQRRRDRLRRDADAPPSGGEQDPQAVGRDPGSIRGLRRAPLGGRRDLAAAVRGTSRGARAERRGAHTLTLDRRPRDCCRLARTRSSARPRRRRREAARSPGRARPTRRRRQGQARADCGLRRRRAAVEVEARPDRDAPARTRRRRRRARLRRLGGRRGKPPRADRRDRSCRCSTGARAELLRAEPLGRQGRSRSRLSGPSSWPRCATTRCRGTGSATARSSCASGPTRILPRARGTSCARRAIRRPDDR